MGKRILGLLIAVLFIWVSAASAAEIQGVRSRMGTSGLRIVVDLNEPSTYTEKSNSDQTELTLTIQGAVKGDIPATIAGGSFAKSVQLSKEGKALIIKVKFAESGNWDILTLKGPDRIVLDLGEPPEVVRESEIAPGIISSYHKTTINGKPVQIYALKIASGAGEIRPVLAGGEVGHRETVSSLAKFWNAIGAVNGGYFASNGQVIGNLKIDNQWVSGAGQNRTAWGFTKDGKNVVGTFSYQGKAVLPDKREVTIDGINVPRGDNQLVLYNFWQGRHTETNEWGLEVQIEDQKITSIRNGDSSLSKKEEVLSAHGQAADLLFGLAPGEIVQIRDKNGNNWEKTIHLISAGPRLIADGKIKVTSREEAFPADISVGRAPRTAIGETAKGATWLIVVDGRSQTSVGMTLEELAKYLRDQGIVEAMNLDGGGSSAIVAEGQILNSPSDGSERRVPTALIVVPKRGK